MSKPLKEMDYFLAWILFWMGSIIGGSVFGAIVGAITGAIMGASGVEMKTIQFVCAILGFLISIPVSFILFRIVVATLVVRKVQANLAAPDATASSDTPAD